MADQTTQIQGCIFKVYSGLDPLILCSVVFAQGGISAEVNGVSSQVFKARQVSTDSSSD